MKAVLGLGGGGVVASVGGRERSERERIGVVRKKNEVSIVRMIARRVCC